MPRGNDSESALAALADKFGQGVGNAEHLIEANLAQVPELLRKAELLPRHEPKTAEVREKIDSLKGPNGEKVIDAVVRGSHAGDLITSIVYVDDSGRYRLGVLDDKNRAVKVETPAVAAGQAEQVESHSKGSDKKKD